MDPRLEAAAAKLQAGDLAGARALRLARRTSDPTFFRLQALAGLTALALSRRRLTEAEQLAQRRFRLGSDPAARRELEWWAPWPTSPRT